MIRNQANQPVSAQMVTIADGSNFTGAVLCDIFLDGSLTPNFTGVSATHISNGKHQIITTAAQNDGATVEYQFYAALAITVLRSYDTTYPQSADNNLILSNLNDFDPAVDTVALVNTCTNNTDMRGTDSALLASSYTAPDNAGITQNGVDIGNLNDISAQDVLTTPFVESYAANGAAPTLTECLLLLQGFFQEFANIGSSPYQVVVKGLDKTTIAAIFDYDSGSPSSLTRTT